MVRLVGHSWGVEVAIPIDGSMAHYSGEGAGGGFTHPVQSFGVFSQVRKSMLIFCQKKIRRSLFCVRFYNLKVWNETLQFTKVARAYFYPSCIPFRPSPSFPGPVRPLVPLRGATRTAGDGPRHRQHRPGQPHSSSDPLNSHPWRQFDAHTWLKHTPHTHTSALARASTHPTMPSSPPHTTGDSNHPLSPVFPPLT